jgi:hypothetical protein
MEIKGPNKAFHLTDNLRLTLIDRRCGRRTLRPLQLLFGAYLAAFVHTNQIFELLDSLENAKDLFRPIL